jgi:hypothetical protein
MSSIGSYIKQQNRVYGALGAGTPAHIDLPLFTRRPFDPSNPNSTSGDFQTFSGISTFNSSTGITPIFRDMGEVIRSAGRTFRRVQMLTQSPSTFGVGGTPSTGAVVSDYQTYWYEVSLLDGYGTMGPLFQIQG